MNRLEIRSSLLAAGYDAELTNGESKLTLAFDAGSRRITLVHEFPDELLRTPKFGLVSGFDGKLAHVGVNREGKPREVCIDDPESTAINTDCPEQVYLETAKNCVDLLTRLIEDPVYDREEQLREFEAHWQILCRDTDELFVGWDGQKTQGIEVRPPRAESASVLRKTHIALANLQHPESVCDAADWAKRQTVGKAVGVRLSWLDPAPAVREELLAWYFNAIGRVNSADRQALKQLSTKSTCNYWIIFSAPIPNGETMFAVRWQSTSPGRLPKAMEQADQWTATPYRVRSLSPASLVPRGGGSVNLSEKSVLLVGCGSVGSELALRLTSAGVGQLTISDPDTFAEENFYRHALTVYDIGRLKTKALAGTISRRHPWAKVTACRKRLEEFRESAILRRFDLVVIAIGSPTVERVFAEYHRREDLDVPVMNCWLEGHGIGGHTILAVSGAKGCWHCAYVDPTTLKHGLTSNLNFLKPGQAALRNLGGCGTQFLPYSGIAANCTATMAADLAVRYLTGEVTTSSKVSWKGDSAQALSASLEVTWRYRHFAESLQTLPLYDVNCDLCGA